MYVLRAGAGTDAARQFPSHPRLVEVGLHETERLHRLLHRLRMPDLDGARRVVIIDGLDVVRRRLVLLRGIIGSGGLGLLATGRRRPARGLELLRRADPRVGRHRHWPLGVPDPHRPAVQCAGYLRLPGQLARHCGDRAEERSAHRERPPRHLGALVICRALSGDFCAIPYVAIVAAYWARDGCTNGGGQQRDWLLEVIAHREMEAFDRAIDLRITRLRKKIEVGRDQLAAKDPELAKLYATASAWNHAAEEHQRKTGWGR